MIYLLPGTLLDDCLAVIKIDDEFLLWFYYVAVFPVAVYFLELEDPPFILSACCLD